MRTNLKSANFPSLLANRKMQKWTGLLLGILLIAGGQSVSAQEKYKVVVPQQLDGVTVADIQVQLPFHDASGIRKYKITIAEGASLLVFSDGTKTLTDDYSLIGTAGTITFGVKALNGMVLAPGTHELSIEMFTIEGVCGLSADFQIQIMKKPVLNLMTDKVWCNADNANKILTGTISDVEGADAVQYAWTSNSTISGGVTSSAGKLTYPAVGGISENLTLNNTTQAQVSAIYTVTPYATYNGLVVTGEPKTVTVRVNPELDMTLAVANAQICSGTNAVMTPSSSITDGTNKYAWVRSDVAGITPTPAGSATEVLFSAGGVTEQLTNANPDAETVTYTVTQHYIKSEVTCSSDPATITVTVLQAPEATLAAASGAMCNGTDHFIAVTTSKNDINFEISSITGDHAKLSNGKNGAMVFADGKVQIPTTNGSPLSLVNASEEAKVTYAIEPYITNGAGKCSGASMSYALTVHPTPTVQLSVSGVEICQNMEGSVGISSSVTTSSPVSYVITAAGDANFTAGEGAMAGTTVNAGIWTTPTLAHANTDYVSRTYQVTPKIDECAGTGETFEVKVVPSIDLSVNTSPVVVVCSRDEMSEISITSLNAAAVQTHMTLAWSLDYESADLEVQKDGVAQSNPATGGSDFSSDAEKIVLINKTIGAVTAELGVTASYVNAGGATCPTVEKDIQITVNPKPTFKLGLAE